MSSDTYRLPDGWSSPEVVEDAVVADGVELRRAGICSRGPSGEELTGAAVEVLASPTDRSRFELLERVSTIEALRSLPAEYDLLTAQHEPLGRARADDVFPESPAPSTWRYARSNGVALHASWEQATARAFWELGERDRVLRAWYGETRPERLAFATSATPLEASRSYDWRAYSFPEPNPKGFSSGVQVVGLFGLPERSTAPVISGYAARPLRAAALEAAMSEALQLLGFLWDEPVIERPPTRAPTPLYHLEYFQWSGHRDVRRWLDDGHERCAAAAEGRRVCARGRGVSSESVAFVDLTPAWLGGGLRVAKAVCDAATPLAFGESPFSAHLPGDLRTHPIG